MRWSARLVLVAAIAAGCDDTSPLVAGSATTPASVALDEIPVTGRKPLGPGGLKAGIYEVRAAKTSPTCAREALEALAPAPAALRVREVIDGDRATFELATCADLAACRAAFPRAVVAVLSEQDDVGRVHGELLEPGTPSDGRCGGARSVEARLEPLSGSERRIALRERRGTIPAKDGACTADGARSALADEPCRLTVFDVAFVEPPPG
jgi:hypothetical protein